MRIEMETTYTMYATVEEFELLYAITKILIIDLRLFNE